MSEDTADIVISGIIIVVMFVAVVVFGNLLGVIAGK